VSRGFNGELTARHSPTAEELTRRGGPRRGGLRWTACLLALVSCGTARAQSDVGSEPFLSGAEGRIFNGTTPLRLWHRTRGYGQEASDTAFGGRLAIDLADAIGFVDGQFRVSNESRGGGNFGGGFRWINDSLLTGTPRILGVSGWYDGQETLLDNYFNQMGVSFESLGEVIDLRLNANIPLEERKDGEQIMVTDAFTFAGNALAQATIVPTDVALRVVDSEIAARVLDLNAWFYGGAYQMDGDGISETGAKGGVRGYLTNDLAVDVGVTDDQEFGTNTVFQVIWTPGRTGAGPTSWVHRLGDRMREHVYRNTYVATQQVTREGAIALTDPAGLAIRIVHVDSDAPSGGDGTRENPLNSLEAVDEFSEPGDIILVHAQSVFNGQTATLQDEQRFLGEGGNETHTVLTSEIGEVTLPETFAGALMAARPIIQNNATTDSVVLAGSVADTDDFDPIEVSNFTFEGGRHAVFSSSGGPVDVNRVEMTDGEGVGINLENLRDTATITDLVWDGGTTGDGAIRIADAEAGSNVVVNGTNDIRNGQTGTPNSLGYAINLEDSDGAMAVTGTTVLNTGGDSVIIDGGAINLTFTGRIDQNSNASVVSVLDGHTGTVNFNELTANAGVISATNGDGMQFADADGTYRFNDTVTLNGGDAGIDVVAGTDGVDGSEGTFTFDDADITNPTGTALNIDGNNLTAFTISGEINTNNVAGRPVVIEDNTGGSITINSEIDSDFRGILVQNNDDTAILFAGETDITTTGNVDGLTNTGVQLTNNTTGSVRFNNLNITTDVGDGFVATDTDALTVAGTGNTITTTTGTGLELTDVAVATTDVTFESVTVNGAANGIVLSNVTGDLVTITGTGTTDGSGGSIVATGDAVLITNAARVSFNNMTVTTSGAADQAIDYNVTTAGESRLALTNNTITIGAGGTAEAVLLNIGADALTSHVRLVGNDISNLGDDEAVRLQTTGASLKTVNLLVQNNTITSDSSSATEAAGNFQVFGGAVVNAMVLNNNFTNTGAGSAFEMTTNEAGSQVHLDLNANVATSTPDEYILNVVAGNYFLDNLATVTTRNTGTVNVDLAIVEEPGTIPTAQAP